MSYQDIAYNVSKKFIGNDINKLDLKKIIAKSFKKNGFQTIGILKKVGFKEDKWIDAIYMQKVLDEKN